MRDLADAKEQLNKAVHARKYHEEKKSLQLLQKAEDDRVRCDLAQKLQNANDAVGRTRREQRAAEEARKSLEQHTKILAETHASLQEEKRKLTRLQDSVTETRTKLEAATQSAEEIEKQGISKLDQATAQKREVELKLSSATEKEKKADLKLFSAKEQEKEARSKLAFATEQDTEARSKLSSATEQEKEAKAKLSSAVEQQHKAASQLASAEILEQQIDTKLSLVIQHEQLARKDRAEAEIVRKRADDDRRSAAESREQSQDINTLLKLLQDNHAGQVSDLERRLQSRDNEVTILRDQVSRLRANEHSKDTLIRENQDDLDGAQEEIKSLKFQLGSAKNRAHAESAAAGAARRLVDQHLANACQGLHIANQDRITSQTLAGLVDEYQSKSRQLDTDTDARIIAAKAERDVLKSELDTMKVNLANAEANANLSAQQLSEITQTLHSKGFEVETANSKLDRMQIDHVDAEQRYHSEMQAVVEDRDHIQTQLQDANQRNDQLQSEQRIAQQQLIDLQAELARRREAEEHSTPWGQTVREYSAYLLSLAPECSGNSGEYGPGYRAIGDPLWRLHRTIVPLLIKPKSRDKFTAFMASTSKPDGWYCMRQICSAGHDTAGPLDGACLHHSGAECKLHVKHLATHSNGKHLDFRVPYEEAEVEMEGLVGNEEDQVMEDVAARTT